MNPPLSTRLVRIACSVLLPVLVTGCRTYNDEIAPLVDPYARGSFQLAAGVVQSDAYQRKLKGNTDGLLFLLEGGKVLQDAGRYDESAALFDRAGIRLEEFDQAADVSITEELGASVGTQASRAYRGTDYDRILLELYQAFNELGRGDLGEALVRTRRVYRRQAEAVARNAAEIEARKEDENASAQAALASENYQEFEKDLDAIKGEAYGDFVNPMGTFLSAILLREEGSQEDSIFDLRRLIELQPDNTWLPGLLEEFESSTAPTPGRVYVVFENGLGPIRVQHSLLLPTPNGWTRFAVPRLVTFPSEVGHLRIRDIDGELDATTQQIASLDSIVAAEFQTKLSGDIWRMVVSQIAKQVVSNAVTRDDHYGIFSLAAFLYRILSSDADLRTWRTIGAEFEIAYGEVPADGLVEVSYPGHPGSSVNVRIPPARTTILFVRSPRVATIIPRVFSIGTSGTNAAAKPRVPANLRRPLNESHPNNLASSNPPRVDSTSTSPSKSSALIEQS